MALNRSHYQVLGVTPEASDREIKRAYHRLARTMHPDKASSPEEAKRLETDFALISTAYNVLKDSDKRREYDAQLKPEPGASASSTSQAPSSGSTAPSAASARSNKAGVAQSESMDEARAAIAKKAFARGMAFYNMKEYAKAIEYFEAALQNNGSEPLYMARLAKALIHARRSFTRARDLAKRAIDTDPYNSEFRVVLAEVCDAAGIQSMALQAYKDVLKWDPDNTKALIRLAELEKAGKKGLFSKLFGKIRKQ
ncbi:MAG: DnaJ-like protein MG200 [candidate division BRC1 bacterium ADurb.BinA364]|nr:MAG: DnaJ-like protein MG200 [candidate division BRC1 bacterium ADurb.BinA364]